MYFDSKNNRTLLRDGTSIVSSLTFAKLIIEGKPTNHLKVQSDRSVRLFEFRTNKPIAGELHEIHVKPNQPNNARFHDIAWIEQTIAKSPRFNGTDVELDRIAEELSFFIAHNHTPFIKRVFELIQRFKDENVLWGVGRGSSCASYILYLLEVHDVNSLKYHIPFSELTKEVVKDEE